MARRYPQRPLVGVAGVVLRGSRVLLVKRGHEPAKGVWSLPGGLLELGESLAQGCAREIKEETGLEATVGPLVEVIERILRDDEKKVEYHYVVCDFVCRAHEGSPKAGDDAEMVAWVELSQLQSLDLTSQLKEVVAKAWAMAKQEDARGWPVR